MANHPRSIDLAEAERCALERLQRSPSTASGLTRRARVVLLAEQLAGTEVARRTGYTPVQISRIRRRFAEEGLAGLADKPSSGHPPTMTEAKSARIVALTLKSPPPGLSHWSTREIADRVGVSHTTVHRIWKAHAVQPHRVETFKFTTDPNAEAKIRDIVRLYLNPPTKAVVVSLDEKTQIQALERTQPILPLRPQTVRAGMDTVDTSGQENGRRLLEIRKRRPLRDPSLPVRSAHIPHCEARSARDPRPSLPRRLTSDSPGRLGRPPYRISLRFRSPI